MKFETHWRNAFFTLFTFFYWKNRRRVLQLPLQHEEIDASKILHETRMYEIRDWYVYTHRLTRLNKDGTDQELLKASVDHIFPSK